MDTERLDNATTFPSERTDRHLRNFCYAKLLRGCTLPERKREAYPFPIRSRSNVTSLTITIIILIIFVIYIYCLVIKNRLMRSKVKFEKKKKSLTPKTQRVARPRVAGSLGSPERARNISRDANKLLHSRTENTLDD